MTRPTEDDLIARYFAPLATHPGAERLRDDAAVITPPPGHGLVITADALVAGVHFLGDDPPATIAQKALRVNLSDLAAKGAAPYGFILSLALPGDWTEAWLAGFAAGLAEDCAAFGIALLGGDTVKTPGPLMVAITAFGTVPRDAIPRRSGARPGDRLYVSGTIGDGALGLLVRTGRDGDFAKALSPDERTFLLSRYQVPRPRLALAPAVLRHASASMDISDGFVGDLTKMLHASGAAATVEVGRIPLSPAGRAAVEARPDRLETVLTGGDDYEILCAIPAASAEAFESAARHAGVAVAQVGLVTVGEGPPALIGSGGEALHFKRGSFSHF